MEEALKDLGFEIDDEFDHYLPRTSELCDKALEILIKARGRATEPLVVWDEANLLIDGHRRLRCCLKLGLPYEVRRISCRDREEAKHEMEMIQYSRRNMSDHEQAIWAKKNHDTLVGEGMTSTQAVKAIAEQNKVSERTIHRKIRYGEAFERLPEVWQNEIVRQNIPEKYVAEIAELNRRNQDLLLERVRKQGAVYLSRRAQRIADDEKRKRARKRVPKQETAEVEEELSTPAELDNKRKSERVLLLVDEAERALGKSTRAVYKLCGSQGLDAPDGYWKRRADKAHRDLMEVLAEIRAKYEE